MLTSYSQYLPASRQDDELLSVAEISKGIAMPANMLIKIGNPEHYKYIAMCLMYRGDVDLGERGGALKTMCHDRKMQFV